MGHVVKAENGTYTSQLRILVGDEMNRSTISCAHDSGMATSLIGSTLLIITTGEYVQYSNHLMPYIKVTYMQFHFLHQLMFSLWKQTVLFSLSTGPKFHLIVHRFNITLRHPTAESVLTLPTVTLLLVAEATHRL